MVTSLTITLCGLLGLMLGSFANAVSLRYDPDRFIFAPANGRSHCPHCGKTLHALELIPVISWLALRGKCRGCKAPISARYPLVEIVTAGAMMSVPFGMAAISTQFLEPWRLTLAYVCWGIIVLFLVIITLIDFKHYLIPDEATIAIGVSGVIAAWATSPVFTDATGSFLGSYAMLAGLHGNWLLGHIVGAVAACGVLLALYVITRGRGLGFGDVKLGLALGLAFAWPDGLVLVGLAFILGSLAALPALFMRRAGLKTALPFGPFLALAAIVMLAFGVPLARAYFGILLL